MIDPSQVTGSNGTEFLSAVTGNQDVNREDFLKLLIAQLQHQDPLNPTENQEFVAELATFSSLEQQTQQTKLLEQMISMQQGNNTSQALALIGKEVSAAQTRIAYEPGQEINFDFKTNQSGNTVVQIVTDSGTVVDTEIISTPQPGQYNYTFDGVRSDGAQLPPGVYNVIIGGTMDGGGNNEALPTYMRGTVEGVNFQDGEPVLLISGQPIALSQVNAVFDKRNES